MLHDVSAAAVVQHTAYRSSAKYPFPRRPLCGDHISRTHTTLPCPSLQKDATQLGLLVLSAMLASHSMDEAKRYSSNACYELRDDTAMPLKLVSLLVAVCLMLKLCQ
jgi:hypothetical protein